MGRALPAFVTLYEPCDFVVVRAPALPVEAYHELSRGRNAQPTEEVRCALAVGSVRFLDDWERSRKETSRRARVESTLLRYLIRMSTRPTPFGLFAGVGLGGWGDRTDLELADRGFRRRTRPDMAWLMQLVTELESVPDVRRHLRFFANRAALVRAGRVLLAERVSRGEDRVPPGVSIRATGVVRRALEAAREPIPIETLASSLVESTPGATPAKVEALLTALWEQTLLLTDLRPPLTVESPARYVVDRLEDIPAAAEVRKRLLSTLEAAAVWDAAPREHGAERYRAMVSRAADLGSFDRSPFQVDAAVDLAGRTLSRRVAGEAARAAELLLRLSPVPRGPGHLSAYRRLFEQRYGAHREVPVLELLDPNFGLGPPPAYTPQSVGRAGVSQAGSPERNRLLLELAVTAIRDRTRCVDLDDTTLERLETWTPSAVDAPHSLDLYISVAAPSSAALDAGEFEIAVGPNVGGMAAGRTLGRFADLLPEARAALRRVATAEEALEPDKLWAELAYQPRWPRLGNVSVRPNVRGYEIHVGVGVGGDGARPIPVDELVVGLRSGRFYLHWPAAGQDVVIAAGHMLSHLRAPTLCRFLSEVGRDGCCQLAGFQWGAAATLPFLPRVRAGRIVLALARWRLAAADLGTEAIRDPDTFRRGLERWRESWQVPRHVYLNAGDNRLLLDLSVSMQADELRRGLLRNRAEEGVVVSEVFPTLEQAWVRDSRGRQFTTEFVVPLVLSSRDGDRAPAARRLAVSVSRSSYLRPPGSEWLYAKLYGGRDLENDLLAGPVRSFTRDVASAGAIDEWFFVRYNDPGRHVRLRFRGDPARLTERLVPVLLAWVDDLIEEGLCRRLALDTYEREVERFGGDEGTRAAETLFASDSKAVVDLLDLVQTQTLDLPRLPLAVLTVDALLEGLGLDSEAKFRWCQRHVRGRQEARAEYRTWKQALRPLLSDSRRLLSEAGGGELDKILTRLRASSAEFKESLDRLESHDRLTRSASELYQSVVHLHLNRLLGAESSVESRVLGLLWRVQEGLHRSG